MVLNGIIPALVTPMHTDGEVHWQQLERFYQWHASFDTSAVVLAGSTGEGALLSLDEKQRLWACGRSVFKRQKVIAGIASVSTRQAIEQAKLAEAQGCDYLLVSVPHYCRPEHEGLVLHFKQVADSVNIPLLLYNIPSRSAVFLLNEDALSLMQHERIVGIKDSSGLHAMSGLLLSKPEHRSYLIGDDHASSIAFSAGADGLVSVLANLFPGLMVDWYEFHRARHDSKDRLSVLRSQLSPWFDALMGPNPSLIKYCLSQVLGLSTSCRLPLCEPRKDLINRLHELVGHDLTNYHKYCPHWEFKAN